MYEAKPRKNGIPSDTIDDQLWDEYFLNDEDEDEKEKSDDSRTNDQREASCKGEPFQDDRGKSDDTSLCEADRETPYLEKQKARQISISSSGRKISKPQETLDQHQSILFTLPYEIRALIWTSVVGGGLVHITELRSTLGHVGCMDRTGQKWGMWQHDCWYCSLVVHGFYVAPETYGNPEDRHIRPGSLGLLRSCQRLYSDAIDVLYERNTFGMRSLGTLHLFLDSLVPKRLEHITSIYISPHVHPDYRGFETTFKLLATVPNLKRLCVELRGNLFRQPAWMKAKLLQAMCCVEQTEVYEVKIPWELVDLSDWLWACPFSLEGVYGEVIESGEREYLALLRNQRVDVRDWFFPGRKVLAEC